MAKLRPNLTPEFVFTSNPENMANTLTAFQELMEHGEDLWDQIVTHRFIKNVRIQVTVSCSLSF